MKYVFIIFAVLHKLTERTKGGHVRIRQTTNNRGISLIIVLWVMLLLTTIVTEFAYTMRVETDAARNFRDETSAYYIATAGIQMALNEISEGSDFVMIDGNGRLAFVKIEDGDIKPVEAKRELDLGEGRVAYSIYDEKGKININTASWETVETLLMLSGVEKAQSDIIVDSIVDWGDVDHEHHLNGAESDYYISLPTPYEAKNGPMDAVEELLLVQGMNPRIFYGDGSVPPEFGTAGISEAPDLTYSGISNHLTVYGDGEININTADEKVLEAVLGKGKADEVMLRRNTEGFFELPAYEGVVTSNVFSIIASGEVRGIRSSIKAVAEHIPGTAKTVIRYWSIERI